MILKPFKRWMRFCSTVQLIFEAFAHRVQAEIEEIAQHLLQAEPLRLHGARPRREPGTSC